MKKKQLITSLVSTSVIMSSMIGNVFADNTLEATHNLSNDKSQIHSPDLVDPDQIVSSDELYTIDAENSSDKFIIKINKVGKSKTGTYSSYQVNQKISNNRIDFTVITDKGTTLGKLENSQSILDSKKELPDGKVEYKFHYTLFNYSPVRVININVTPIEENTTPTDSVVQ